VFAADAVQADGGVQEFTSGSGVRKAGADAWGGEAHDCIGYGTQALVHHFVAQVFGALSTSLFPEACHVILERLLSCW
jgi:hypothetical protein